MFVFNQFQFPRAVHEHLVHQVRQQQREHQARLAALRTAADARKYQQQVKRAIFKCFFDKLPARTPLKLRCTGVTERPDYRIEKLVFESRPGYPVTANCYVPTSPRPAAGYPAVLGTCGHSQRGKGEPAYQTFSRHLAKLGYVTLIYDPVAQGERLQYPGTAGRFAPTSCVFEHNMMGKQMALVGEFLGAWRAWDGIRALDVLLARNDVDRTRVGLTGNSGGGTMSTYLNALDDRFTMTAPSCFVTTHLANLENELPADNEQCPPGFLAAGLDRCDFFIAQAPRPVLLLGQAQDFFDTRGLETTYQQVRRFYALLGAQQNARLFIGPAPHGFSVHNREQMYRFFNQQIGSTKSWRESLPDNEPDDVLAATPTGQVAGLKGQKFIHELTAAHARQLKSKRKTPASAPALARQVREFLGLPARIKTPYFRSLRAVEGVGAYPAVWRFGLETEPGYGQVMALLSAWDYRKPDHSYAYPAPPRREKLTLYVGHISTRDDLAHGLLPVPTPRQDVLFSVDVRGHGEMQNRACAETDFLTSYGSDYHAASHNLMLGQTYLGRKVLDVLGALELLGSYGAKEVHLVGRGIGALHAAFAALLSPLVKRVTLADYLPSWHLLTQTPIVGWPQSALPHGVLRRFDLPDIYRALRGRRLRLVQPWNAEMQR